MTPFALAEGCIPQDLVKDQQLAQRFLAELPDPAPRHPACRTYQRGREERTLWSCHGLVRAFARLRPGWTVADGWFVRKGSEHAWLWRHFGEDGTVILDVYPVAGIAPILVDATGMSPWRDAYIEAAMNYRAEERARFEAEAEHALQILKETGLAA